MPAIQRVTRGFFSRTLGRLRFPTLFVLTGVAFLIDLVVPDAIPLADEIFLMLLTALLGSFKDRRQKEPAPARTGEPSSEGPAPSGSPPESRT